MPRSCCIAKCKNTRKQGFHFFRLPFTRPDILQKWINAIGGEFIPTKNHLICSAHFVRTDFMERPNASDVRLKNLAVPSIFLEAPAFGITPAMESGTTPAVECGRTPAMESDTTPVVKRDPTPAMEYGTTSLRKFGTTVAPTSAVKNVSVTVWRSILKAKEDNATVPASIPLPRTQPASATGDTVKMAMRKSIKIMGSSFLHLKKQEISPRKKHMLTTIKTLKQKLKRKEAKIDSLENLLKTVRYYKLSSKA